MTGRNNLPGYGAPVSTFPMGWSTYTPVVTQTGNTFTGVVGMAYRLPGLCIISVSFTAVSTVAGVLLFIGLPTGVAVSTPIANPGVGTVARAGGAEDCRILYTGNGNLNVQALESLTAGAVYSAHAVVPVAL